MPVSGSNLKPLWFQLPTSPNRPSRYPPESQVAAQYINSEDFLPCLHLPDEFLATSTLVHKNAALIG
jgi:hypothetical protein